MSKPVILTGLRANNDLHLGNYFGALLPLVDMVTSHSGEYAVNLFVPDLHSFTTPIDHSQLYSQTLHNVKLFLAAGLPLDNPDIRIYRQSFIPAHSELTWILDCFTGFGEMSRMTQFKDKSAKLNADRVSVGLFNYPVLMAADVLLYGAEYVPVGDDQTQHLEFIRDVAERINNQFGGLFVIPAPVPKQHAFFGNDQGLRIRDLQDPSKKMSKSDESVKGIIFLGDDPIEAGKKIMSATTDSLAKIPTEQDYEQQPGISNLLDLLALLTHQTRQAVYESWGGKSEYGPLKQVVAEATTKFLTDFQAILALVDEQALLQKIQHDEAAMNEQANRTLNKVQQAVGLRAHE